MVYSLLFGGGLTIGWSSFTVGVLYIVCGFSGFRAAVAKHVAAARQVPSSLSCLSFVYSHISCSTSACSS